MREIHVLGWYDTPTSATPKCNLGDEAYKLAFPKLFPNYKFTFCDTLKGLNPETVILGGGDVIQPFFINQITNSNAKKKFAFSVNIRPDTDLSIFDRTISRNYSDKAEYFPDFVFALNADRTRGKNLIKSLFYNNKCDLYDNVVVIVMNSFLSTKENTLARDDINFNKVCFDLAKIMDTTSASFILLPFGNGFPYNDKIANSAVYSKCKFWKKNLLVFDSLSIQDTLDIFAGADASINTRLHANIFSCIGGTPFIDLAHHDKTKMFMKSINRSNWSFNYWHFDFEMIKSLLNATFANKEAYRNSIDEIALEQKTLLKKFNFFLYGSRSTD